MLLEQILKLINSKREGDFWDFKEKHHDNNALLLHDILCLANAVTKTNKYLIYGVSDPASGCDVKGLDAAGNRKSQSDIIDFLRAQNFAGDIRPEIELKHFQLDDKIIDVLVIFDHSQKPYYLTEDYRDRQNVVKANYIYTRNFDTNTPITSSADLSRVEAMWRERFGLDLQPAQRMVELLRCPEEWDKDIGNRGYAYHKCHPEYQIQFGEPKEFKNVYSYFYINERSFIGTAAFKCLSTELFTLPYIYCDEMRIELAEPKNGCIHSGRREVWYMYYELDSRNGAFLHFLTNGSFDFNSRMGEAPFVCFFDNKLQRKEFEAFLAANIANLDKMPDDELGVIKQDRITKAGESFIFKPVEMIKVRDMFNQWKQNIS